MRTKNGLDIEIEIEIEIENGGREMTIRKSNGWSLDDVVLLFKFLDTLPGEKPVEEISKEKANDAMPQL